MVVALGALLMTGCGASETTRPSSTSTTAPVRSTVQSAQIARTIGVSERPSELPPLDEDVVVPDDRVTGVATSWRVVYVSPPREAVARCEATDFLPDPTTYKNISCEL